jgi:hypothetical protein
MNKVLLITVFLLSPTIFLYAQTTVTFNVNLRTMLKDSTFIPGQDVIQITGNVYPLDKRRGIELSDGTPADSVYSVEIDFPRRRNSQNLLYSFEVKKPYDSITENAPRSLNLVGEDQVLPPMIFNSFVQ